MESAYLNIHNPRNKFHTVRLYILLSVTLRACKNLFSSFIVLKQFSIFFNSFISTKINKNLFGEKLGFILIFPKSHQKINKIN